MQPVSYAGPRIGTLSLLGSMLCFSCYSPSSDSSTPLFFTNVSIVNGLGESLTTEMFVEVRDSLIADIGAMDTISLPNDAVQIDGSGLFVLPGFIDLHVHFPEDSAIQVAILSQLVDYGITTILNPGARPSAGVELRRKVQTIEIDKAPDMFTSGRIIDSPPIEDGLESWAAPVSTRSEMISEVQHQVGTGVDFIKLYRHVPDSLVEAAIIEARDHGVQVVGHMGKTDWTTAASYGISMLVHSGWGTPMDELVYLAEPDNATDAEWYHAYARATEYDEFKEFSKLLVDAGVTVVPTMSVHQAATLGRDATLLPIFETHLAPDAYADDWWSDGWETRHPQFGADSEEEEDLMMTVLFPGILSIVGGYYNQGVMLGVGTDVGNSWMTPGAVFHHELELYHDAGIRPVDIVQMATYNGAMALGIVDDRGSIEIGKRADLILLSENPLTDIRNTRSIQAVYQDGVLVSGG